MKKKRSRPEFMLMCGVVIAWFMYTLGKMNGLMMGGNYTITEALVQSFDVVAFGLIVFLFITLIISIFKKQRKGD
jgi:TRAP-type C4-dicarboxylate transport system permease small subunit